MTSLAQALAQLDGKALLTAQDALDFRRMLYGGDQVVTAQDAEALVKLNADAGDTSPEWRMLYIEALTDYVVRQEEPSGYVDQAKADWLMAAVSRDGFAKDDEVEILICVLERADTAPDKLPAFALDTLKARILRTAASGVSREDVERLRRVLFTVGGDQNIGVSHREAEALFELNDALRGAPNDPAWTDFFVRAVANAVLYEATYHAPDAHEELRREAWLGDGSFHLLAGVSAWLHPLKAILTPNVEQAWRAGLAADEAIEAEASQITSEEGHWLADRIGRDGRFDANERALVRFLAANASRIDPSLQPLIAQLSDHPGMRSGA